MGKGESVKWGELDIHPANTQQEMKPDALKRLAADIEANGLKQPLVIFYDNADEAKGGKGPFKYWRFDGLNRAKALKKIGVDDPNQAPGGLIDNIRVVSAAQKSTNLSGSKTYWEITDPYELHKALNVHRRHLTPKQQKEEIKRIAKAEPHKSDSDIARDVGVSDKTVAKVRSSNSDIPKKTSPSERAAKAIADNPQASNVAIAKAAKTGEATVRRARKAKEKKPAKPKADKPPKPTKAEKQAQKAEEQEQAERELAEWFAVVAKRDNIGIPTLITWLEEANMKNVITLLRKAGKK